MAWYKLAIQPDGDVWLVTSPDFEEVVSFGKTQEEACRNGRNAIEEAIAGRIADGEDIPHPLQEPEGHGRWVEVPMMVYLKSAIYMLMREKQWTRADLQRALGWSHREQIDRLFRLDHQTKLDAIEDAFKALGVPLRVDVPFHASAAAA
ncbi:type II toxin-antitoxin system HicB family antitoxin [Rhizobium leguminosarum]|uniref:type II toxin-antitoxin system HicB family antitoxin n=1 Tax=Rhizobium leguminosarum TaxID=384 RepID=UPI001038DF6E|nr:type II toxin-antitoxin system HicB family antitoxin [Rhizobium leguminosarum]TBY41613.1 type II toxin-antitoxin system HicB family antitoxin [Rhizobium leguminosarum bv. viciae]